MLHGKNKKKLCRRESAHHPADIVSFTEGHALSATASYVHQWLHAQCLKWSSVDNEANLEFARVESSGECDNTIRVATAFEVSLERVECRRLFRNTVAAVFLQSGQGWTGPTRDIINPTLENKC